MKLNNPKIIYFKKLPIELYQILKVEELVNSGGEAKQYIADGKVMINNSVETRKRKKVFAGDFITFNELNYLVEESVNE
ncbi:MAG: RNA-binding S4 domain-containing protein [Ignavibacteriae bacterium]|nr:RNA-binding S4 domain-containing protein [Ignavibacteriota bacterium]NOH00302.1 RNA-binding S4 domain-containing protein [Ignavibacteriota bacterium]